MHQNFDDEVNSVTSNAAVAADGDEVASDTARSEDEEMIQSQDNEENNNDEEYKFEWSDTFLYPASLTAINSDWKYKTKNFLWKGADWNILLIIEKSRIGCEMGVFLGYDSSESLPIGWKLPLTYKIYLYGENDVKYLESRSVDHTFVPSSQIKERYDQGSWNLFNLAIIANFVKSNAVPIMVGKISMYPLRIKITIEEHFLPASVPVGYNSKASTGMVGLENLGATCYLNALLQMLYHLNEFRRAVYLLPHKDEILKSSTTLALQSVFKNLQTSNREVSTKDLTTAFGWTTAEAFLQQDVQEMMRVLLDKLEDKMKGTVVDGCVKKLFAGTLRSFIRCVNVDYESKREEDFYDIQLDVKGCQNIHESFAKYTNTELLNGENQYDAGEFGKQDASKGVIFTKFPPVLTVHLKRFDFDFNTMGFTKIHDHFEFPTRLQLDQYLAEDCPEESRKVPNHYQLHSVLVHSGDVGGGHYYAYIRPSTHFDYGNPTGIKSTKKNANDNEKGVTNEDPTADANATANEKKNGTNKNLKLSQIHKASSDAQWFKFNDETVLSVKYREAVESCFGRKPTKDAIENFYRSISSAYMLVYIRESEAASIMSEVTEKDISTDLVERLENELALRKQAELKMLRERYFTTISVATENDIRNFVSYSRLNDFFNEDALEDIKIMRSSSRLYAHLRIAEHLSVSPFCFRLWTIERKSMKQSNAVSVRLIEDVLSEDWKKLSSNEKFFVDFFPDNSNSTNAEFDSKLKDLKLKESEWLNRLRVELYEMSQYSNATDNDPVECCGIGSGNIPLTDLDKAGKTEVAAAFMKEIEELTASVTELFTQRFKDLKKDEILMFFKIFDPYNDFPLIRPNVIHATESNEILYDDDEANADAHNDSNAVVPAIESKLEDGDAFEEKTEKKSTTVTRALKKTLSSAEKMYIPMKYIGFRRIKTSNLVGTLVLTAHELLASAYKENNPDGVLPSRWADPTKCRLSICEQSTKLIEVISKYHHIPVNDFLGQLANALMLFEARLPNVPSATNDNSAPITSQQSMAPLKIIEPLDWLRYMSFRRDFQIKPLKDRDLEIVTKLLTQKVEKLRKTLQIENSLKKTEDQSESSESLLYFALGVESNESKTSDVLNADSKNELARLEELLLHVKETSGTLSMEIPLNFRSDEILKMISEKLSVDRSHLVLYVVPRMNSIENSLSYAERVSPISMFETLTLNEIIMKSKIAVKSSTKFFMFYQLLPFSIYSNSAGNKLGDVRQTVKMSEIRIVDDRLRKWRRLYLEHLVHQGASNVSESTGLLNDSDTMDLEYSDAVGTNVATLNSAAGTSNAVVGKDYPQKVSGTNHRETFSSQMKRRRIDETSKQVREKLAISNNVTLEKNDAVPLNSGNSPNAFDDYDVEPIWNPSANEESVYNLLEMNKIHMHVNMDTLMCEVSKTVRDLIGIPSNIDQLLSPEYFTLPADVTEAILTPHTASNIRLQHQQRQRIQASNSIILPSKPTRESSLVSLFSTGEGAVVSDHLDFTKLTPENDSEDVINGASTENKTRLVVEPAFPLALLSLRYKVVNEIFAYHKTASESVASWLESKNPIVNLYDTAVQHISPQDLVFIKGEHPTIKSMLISVFNFTLLGNVVDVCDVDLFSGPFVSYVREDDDYASLIDRLGQISGDDDWDKCRLAVVKEKIPHFIPRPPSVNNHKTFPPSGSNAALSSVVDVNTEVAMAIDVGSVESSEVHAVGKSVAISTPTVPTIWSLFQDKYPDFAANSIDLVRTTMLKRMQLSECYYPQLGIQRSVTDISISTRTRKFGGSGIRIS